MVAHNHENGILEPRSGPGVLKKFPDGLIGVFYGPVSAGTRGNIDFPFRIGVGFVVRGRHYKIKKRLSGLVSFVRFLDDLVVNIRIADAPCVFKGNFVIFDIRAGSGNTFIQKKTTATINDIETVPPEIGVHIVKITVSAVEEITIVPLFPEHLANGKQSRIIFPLYDTAARGRGNGQGYGLHAADSARTRGEQIGEEKAFIGK